MIDIQTLRNTPHTIIAIGTYPAIIQAMIDFDFLSGKDKPSIALILAEGRNHERYFWGKEEILIPVVHEVHSIPDSLQKQITFFVNFSSGRRTKDTTLEILDALPGLIGGALFAEKVPEKHSLRMYAHAKKLGKFIVGPASIGLLLPGSVKLGAIGGTDARQLISADVFQRGSVAVLSASGGMTNELINAVTRSNKRISFSLAFGGERFPVTTPTEAFLAAEKDLETKTIIYFGELGGSDEYDLAQLMQSGSITKPILCYIAGSVAEMFDTPPQFGHAKALAQSKDETARGKRDMLEKAGAQVAESFTEFLSMINALPVDQFEEKSYAHALQLFASRHEALITSSISGDANGVTGLLHEDLLSFVQKRSFAGIVCSLFLGRNEVSPELEEFVDFVLRLLVDHGPNVSGAMNTIVTARAGRDIVSSLVSGLLTIGPRFGGAINQAAENLLLGVTTGQDAADFVESFASTRQYIAGIGHKKYRSDLPDPRVKALKAFGEKLEQKRFLQYALAIEKITTQKKGNLILNVDGAIAAILLDILSEKEHYSDQELQTLVESEFFNAFFILSRSVGFLAHFLDQKRIDEGIFRLPDDLILHI